MGTKRPSVKEMVGALLAAGVSSDNIVIKRELDGTVKVFSRYQKETAKFSALDMWKIQNNYDK